MRISRRAGLVILAAVALGAIGGIFLLPRIPQDPAYHHFADTRILLSIPNCLNVISNLPFLFVGILGLRFLLGVESRAPGNAFATAGETWPYGVFFFGVTLTSLGSAYYIGHRETKRCCRTGCRWRLRSWGFWRRASWNGSAEGVD
jgi:hypothetical protein